MEYIKTIESSRKRKRTSSDNWTLEARTHRRRTRLEPEPPHSRSRDQHTVGGHPSGVRWTVTPSEGKDSDTSDSRKTFMILIC